MLFAAWSRLLLPWLREQEESTGMNPSSLQTLAVKNLRVLIAGNRTRLLSQNRISSTLSLSRF
jgi:hypothetical protein